MLFSSSPNIANTELETLLATLDVEPFIRAAAAYRADAAEIVVLGEPVRAGAAAADRDAGLEEIRW